MTFKIDENLQNYLEIWNWLRSIGKQDYTFYKKIDSNPSYYGTGIYSDISVQILTNKKNPNYEIKIINAFPIAITSLDFDASQETINYVEATARFKYTYYDITKIT